ncbi:MAG: hypothetical protein M1532_01400 [Nitrospirae bacterium]|nr:hypothetical protein [Nitrospirota bacterium]
MKKEVLPEKMPLSIEPNPSPLQDMTLLQRDYVSGEVTLFYLRKKDPGGRNDLMFCVIEFLPPWLEKGPEEDTEYRLGGSSNYTVHFRRVHLPVNDALQLYQDFRNDDPHSRRADWAKQDGRNRYEWDEIPSRNGAFSSTIRGGTVMAASSM